MDRVWFGRKFSLHRKKLTEEKLERRLHTSRSAIEVTDQALPFGYNSNSEHYVNYVSTPYSTHVVFWYMQFDYWSPDRLRVSSALAYFKIGNLCMPCG